MLRSTGAITLHEATYSLVQLDRVLEQATDQHQQQVAAENCRCCRALSALLPSHKQTIKHFSTDKMFSRVLSRSFHASSRVLADAAAAASSGMVLNFCTPHTPIYTSHQVDKVMLPGEIGEYGITAGHSPLISQLKAGIVSIQHVDVSITDVYYRNFLCFHHDDLSVVSHRVNWKSTLFLVGLQLPMLIL